ncbi:MAG: hypothetical protein M3Y36_00220 [Actinomycetota bacterium]|nr:hypothetical protein [Actinomycetota bacterium]
MKLPFAGAPFPLRPLFAVHLIAFIVLLVGANTQSGLVAIVGAIASGLCGAIFGVVLALDANGAVEYLAAWARARRGQFGLVTSIHENPTAIKVIGALFVIIFPVVALSIAEHFASP